MGPSVQYVEELEARIERAERTLQRAGFEDVGGDEWMPPSRPHYEHGIDAYIIAERDAYKRKTEALGAFIVQTIMEDGTPQADAVAQLRSILARSLEHVAAIDAARAATEDVAEEEGAPA